MQNIYRTFISFVIFSSFSLFPINNFSVAQEINQNCSTALILSKKRLKNIDKIQTIVVHTYDVSKAYPDHPVGRSQGYILAMQGSAVSSIMNSPKFMISVAQNIIKNCKDFGMVTFGLDHSGWGISVGLLSNDRIGIFKCLDYKPRAKNQKKLSWGEEYCSL
jgi:hypothetical protein